VALLGGSFNPPHLGHLMAALAMRTLVGVDEVWMVPSFSHPFGKPLAPFADRVAMCEAMIAPVGPWLQVSQAEASVGGEGRTIELLEWLLPRHPGTRFHFVIGADIVADLPKWKAWDRITSLVQVTVLARPGFPLVGTLGPPMADVSSSAIREALERGEPVEGLLPRAVAEYVAARHLYQGEGRPFRARALEGAMSNLHVRVVGAMLEREPGRYLITQRAKWASLPLLWEFPGGKVEGEEADDAALVRELRERLGLDVVVDEEATRAHHEYPTYTVDFRVFHCRLVDPDQVVSHQRINDHRWASLEEMPAYRFPEADAKTLAQLLELEG
jgi:nicotinate-nucleotide adenylyltransferase